MQKSSKEEVLEILEELSQKKKFKSLQYKKLDSLFRNIEFQKCTVNKWDDVKKIIMSAGKSGEMKEYSGRFQYRFAAIAAAVILIISALVIIPRINKIEDNATIVNYVSNEVDVVRGDRILLARAGMKLKAGDEIKNSSRSIMEFAFRDELKIKLGQNGILKIDKIGKDNQGCLDFKVELLQGSALFDFKKFTRNDNAIIYSPNSSAVIRGTRFGVMVRENGNVRYEVQEGKVLVHPRLNLKKTPGDENRMDLSKEIDRYLQKKAVILKKDEIYEVKKYYHDNLKQHAEKALADKKVSPEEMGRIIKQVPDPVVATKRTVKPLLYKDLSNFAAAEWKNRSGELIPLSINSKPHNALITVDKKYTGIGHLSIKTVRGTHTVNVTSRGFKSKQMNFVLSGNESALVVELERIAAQYPEFNYDTWREKTSARYIIPVANKKILISINKDGAIDAVQGTELKWRYNYTRQMNATPVSDGINLYISSKNGNIDAISLNNGNHIWNRKLFGGIHDGVSLALKGNSIIAATAKGSIYKISRMGQLIFSMKIPKGVYATPVVTDNLIFVTTGDGKVFGVDANLKLIVIKYETGPVSGSSLSPSANRIFTANGAGEVLCYDLSLNEIVWRFTASKGMLNSPVIKDRYVYVASRDGAIFKLNMDGDVLWRYNTGGVINSNIEVDGNSVYVLAQNAFYVLDGRDGKVKWSYVTPTRSISNLALMNRHVVFSVEQKGVIVMKK